MTTAPRAARWAGLAALLLTAAVGCMSPAVPAAAPAPLPAPAAVPAAPAAPAALPSPVAPAPKATPKAAPKAAPRPTPRPKITPKSEPVMRTYKGIITGDLVLTCHAKTGRTIARCNAEARDGINKGLIIGPKVAPVAKPKPGPADYALQACRQQTGWTTARCQADAAAGNAN
jgi:hypothetical protein